MRKLGTVALMALALTLWAREVVRISPDRYLADVRFLSSSDLQGRGTGSDGLDQAADYIAAEFRRAGLKPLFRDSYFQTFPVTIKSRLGKHNELSVRKKTVVQDFRPEKDFVPFNFSDSGNVSGQLAFVGYGISAHEYGYDDYAGIDVKGRLVIVLRHEPQEFDSTSPFEGRVYTEHSQLASKAANAREHGAAAVIFVNDTATHQSGEDHLERFASLVAPGGSGVPFVQVRAEIVEEWFREGGQDFRAVQAAIDREGRPQSFVLPESLRVELKADVKRQTRNVRNVVGYLPGQDREYLLAGAHYDHLGLGEQYSLAPGKPGSAHPGADDNASGTAGVLALARWFASHPPTRRGMIFAAFSGEELGLLGSGYYVRNSPLPLASAAAMLNMDMIGRVRDGKVYIGGLNSTNMVPAILDRIKPRYPFTMERAEIGGYGSSDHTTFTSRGIPALFFFSGLHGDYHRPTDTWDKINAPDAARLLELIAELMQELAEAPERPRFLPSNVATTE